ncbi:MAG: reverse transcriptase domain-containing protein [Paludibacteraceae bacterium]
MIEQIADLDNLYSALHKAKRGKQQQPAVLEYVAHIDDNLSCLRQQLLTGQVDVGHYHYFRIYDPKERLISAASFSERVLHHAIMNVCADYFEQNFIYDTYATRPNKGTYKALSRAMDAMKHYGYVAKLDVRKYFDSISHPILKDKLRKLYKDPALLRILDLIIDSYYTEDGRGLPIGNLTSQYFANYYLSETDHYMKEQIKIPVYIRYMDDILLFADSRLELKNAIEVLQQRMQLIDLTLKPVAIYKAYQGIPFLGYRLYAHKILLSGRSKRRFKKKNTLYNNKLNTGEFTEDDYLRHILPLYAFADKAYTKQYRKRLNIEALTA